MLMDSGCFSILKVHYVVEWLLSLTPLTFQYSDWLIEHGCLYIMDMFLLETFQLILVFSDIADETYQEQLGKQIFMFK